MALLSLGLVSESPGQTLPLNRLHPGFTLVNLRPADFQPDVSGMDFLPDGRLAVCTWGGDRNALTTPSKNGRLHLLSGVTGATPSPTVQTVATGLQEPLGLKVVDGEIYMSERQALVRFSAAGQRLSKVADAPGGDLRSEWFYGLEYRDGFFYGSFALNFANGGSIVDPQPNANRGTVAKIDKATGAIEYLAGGFRTHNGIALNPEGEIFVADNQGQWMPANTFTHVVKGRQYGVQPVANPFRAAPVSPPTAWLNQGEVAFSPAQPIYIPEGPYKGQFFLTDVNFGGLQRIFLDKVKGEYNGVAFEHTQGLEAGTHRVVWGPDGALYVGGIGTGSDWYQAGKLKYGLQKLIPNDKAVFEMIAVRSRKGGMEIEFGKPVGASAEAAANYEVRRWTFKPQIGYGQGNKLENTVLTVKSVRVHEDRRRVFLEIDDLRANFLTYINLRNVRSADDEAAWTNKAWYSMHNISEDPPFSTPTSARYHGEGRLSGMPGFTASLAGPGVLRVKVDGAAGPFRVQAYDVRGSMVAEARGVDGGELRLTPRAEAAAGKTLLVRLTSPAGRLSRLVAMP
jgi:hypothetical protein